MILAAAAVVAREKGSDRGYNPHSSLKNQVDSIFVFINRVVDIDQDFFNRQYSGFLWDFYSQPYVTLTTFSILAYLLWKHGHKTI